MHTQLTRIIQLTAILLLMGGLAQTYAQVTIGSASKSAEGALLQLKENDGSNANSMKGLMLPRVALDGTDLTKFVIADDSQKETHIGMMVYALVDPPPPAPTDYCRALPIIEDGAEAGIMVWTGEMWTPLIEKEKDGPGLPSWVHPAVRLVQDVEGNSYTYRYFGKEEHKNMTLEEYKVSNGGSAVGYENEGYWMTQNLRTRTYGSNYPGDKLTLFQSSVPTSSLVYGYPRKYPETDIKISTDFDKFPDMGLLYVQGAITHDENIVDKMQGICPDGWYIPSSADWDNITAYMQKPAQVAEYTTYAAHGETDYKGAFTLTTPCADFMKATSMTNARAKVASDGGFALIAVGWAFVNTGLIGNNLVYEYATSTKYGSASSKAMKFRVGYSSLAQEVVGDFREFTDHPTASLANQMISVRCKADIEPAGY